MAVIIIIVVVVIILIISVMAFSESLMHPSNIHWPPTPFPSLPLPAPPPSAAAYCQPSFQVQFLCVSCVGVPPWRVNCRMMRLGSKTERKLGGGRRRGKWRKEKGGVSSSSSFDLKQKSVFWRAAFCGHSSCSCQRAGLRREKGMEGEGWWGRGGGGEVRSVRGKGGGVLRIMGRRVI